MLLLLGAYHKRSCHADVTCGEKQLNYEGQVSNHNNKEVPYFRLVAHSAVRPDRRNGYEHFAFLCNYKNAHIIVLSIS
jgi:hypothetical protein